MKSDLDLFKDIKKFSKLSLIFSILIFVFLMLFILILPIVIAGLSSSSKPGNYYPENNNQPVAIIVGAGITIFAWVLIFIFSILILIFNVISIIRASSLKNNNDKNLCIIMSVLSILWLGIIANIILIVVSKNNIKRLSLEEQIIDEPTKPVGPNIY